MNVKVANLTKRFGSFVALDDVSFDVRSGDLVALLGPSGGGKSTTLRIIAGLDHPDSGTVAFDGLQVEGDHARKRRVGFVFQHYALFRHMTVAGNIGFGLEVQKLPRAEREQRVGELLRLVNLEGYERQMPAELSGGQRQRVALARALAPRPKLLLLDEPFAAVDAKVRQELRQWVRRLHDETGVTSIFVTHDQEEAFALADRVLVINQGRVEQEGTPLDILDHPATEFVAKFVGDVNVLDARVDGLSAVAGALRVPLERATPDTFVRLIIRAYDLKFWREDNGIATVARLFPLGD
ncbi:MAG TPA: sulfate ABC transporter ATP-binding protein, partial [Gemmatimonadaceae bacterium]|nr:sulfate ABC transporter ATP-binding protein [Gemmatimonadaceae bacterium]